MDWKKETGTISAEDYKDLKESKYYLGDRRISPLTNVKQIRRRNA